MVPRGPQEGSQKGSGPGKGCESIGRCSLFLRKRKKNKKKKIKVKWFLGSLGAPGALKSQKRGPTQSQGGPFRKEQCLIAVLKKGTKKEK